MKIKKVLVLTLIISICFTLLSFGTAAALPETTGSITLNAFDTESKEPVSGAVFRIYRFADAIEKNGEIIFVYTPEFKDNGMDMGNFSDIYLPLHLMTYADEKGLAYTEKATDSSGRVVFDSLPCGAYLVVPSDIAEGYLKPSPFIVTIPSKGTEESPLLYDIDATPKIECDKDDEEKTYISVKKQWQTTEKPPESVTVSLIKDGVIIETVTLSAENNWYHRWDNLDKKHNWSVTEANVPEGYKVSYIASEMTVIITNTLDDYEEETTTEPQDTTTPDDTTKPDGTTKPTKPTESTTKPEELIDTGQLNWPVPVLSIAGLLLFSLGWAILNFGKKENA